MAEGGTEKISYFPFGEAWTRMNPVPGLYWSQPTLLVKT